MINIEDYIISDPDILGGQPVFKGTRVPIDSLFDHLTAGYNIQLFVDQFPSVTLEQVINVLKIAASLVNTVL